MLSDEFHLIESADRFNYLLAQLNVVAETARKLTPNKGSRTSWAPDDKMVAASYRNTGKTFSLSLKSKMRANLANSFRPILNRSIERSRRRRSVTKQETEPQKKKAPERAARKPFSDLSTLRIPLPRITVKRFRRRFGERISFALSKVKKVEPHLSTTPFGRRTLTLAHVASQAIAKTRPPEKAVHKWNIFRAICTAKARIGVSERALAVLDALLTFSSRDRADAAKA